MQHEFKVDSGEVFFAFCFPWSLTDNETLMQRIEQKLGEKKEQEENIYFHRETLGYSLQKRPVEVITLTSMVSSFAPPWRLVLFSALSDACGLVAQEPSDADALQEEPRLPGCYPIESKPRALHFPDKKVFVLSARVHPGETPAAHMLNGILALLLRRDDERAVALRKMYGTSHTIFSPHPAPTVRF